MIRLIRNKLGLKIIEFRYPDKLITVPNCDMIKIYSFKDLTSKGWIKNQVCSMMIDLTKSEEELLANIKKNYRKHMKTEENSGVVIKKASNDLDYKKFYKERYLELCKRENMRPYPYKYLKQGDLWYAEKDGKILCGSIIFHDEEYATQSFAASEHVEYNGHRTLIWKAMKYYKEQGLKWFNFGGGESDYKKRFGSEKFDVWTYVKYVSFKAILMNKIRLIINKIRYKKNEEKN